MSHTAKKIPWSILVVLLFAAAGVTAYLTGGPFGFFGHSNGEIEKGFTFVPQDCDVNPNGGYPYKFCEATCPDGYYAVSGSCQTYPGDDGLGSFVAGLQYTLMGVLPESGLRSYSCFNNEIVEGPAVQPPGYQPAYLTATASCMQSGGASLPDSAECGNYRIDAGEKCDKENLGDWIDCTDFQSVDGTPLCNGSLSCGSTCGAFDVSACVYCDTAQGPCSGGQVYCADLTCQDDCAGHGGAQGTVVGSATCASTGICPTVPGSPGPGGSVCGNGIQEGSETCDTTATGICARIICPDGTSVCKYQICNACQWEWQGDPCGPVGACGAFGITCVSHASCPNGMTCELGCCVPWNV